MKLSDLRKACRLRYLGLFSDEEDVVFTNDALDQLLNDKHRELAFAARLYRTTRRFDLGIGSGGVSFVGLDPDVFAIEPGTVRWTDGTRETTLKYRDEADLLRGGPLFNVTNGTPSFYYLRAGAELGTQLLLILHPGSDTARAGGLLAGCYIYPRLMDNASDTPAFRPAEHQWLVAQVSLEMALIDRARGRPDAPVAEMQAFAVAAEARLRQSQQESHRDGPRRIHYQGGC